MIIEVLQRSYRKSHVFRKGTGEPAAFLEVGCNLSFRQILTLNIKFQSF
jgi:hypothetical protein